MEEWHKIIANCIANADTKIQKLIERVNNQQVKQLVLFKKRVSDEL